MFPTDVTGSSDAYTWGVTASAIESDLEDSDGLNFDVAVTRSGRACRRRTSAMPTPSPSTRTPTA